MVIFVIGIYYCVFFGIGFVDDFGNFFEQNFFCDDDEFVCWFSYFVYFLEVCKLIFLVCQVKGLLIDYKLLGINLY